MDWNAFAQEVHQNAVAHGFWEGERPIDEIFALIHSEWSEALEEYRAGRPMVWYACGEAPAGITCICAPNDEADCLNYGNEQECKYRGHKPEGIAVELVDGCIRILDLLAKEKVYAGDYARIDYAKEIVSRNVDDDQTLPELICTLHSHTVHSLDARNRDYEASFTWLMHAIAHVCIYIKNNGLDPEALMREKHEYNKTRPYKHGKKC